MALPPEGPVIALAAWVIALGAVGALGARLTHAACGAAADPREQVVGDLAVGFGVWGLVALLLAATHTLHPGLVLAAAAAALALGGRAFLHDLRALPLPRRATAWAWGPALLVLAAMLIAAMAPVVTGDQTKYQLAYPKLYAQAGGLVPTPWTFWGQQQFLVNFGLAAAYAVGGEHLAVLLAASWVVLAAGAIAVLVDRHLARRAGIVAGALLVTMPIAWSLTTKVGSDLALVATTLLAVSAFLDWRRGGEGRTLRRAALAAGVAAGTKVMGLLTPGLLGLAILALAPRALGIGGRLRAAVTFGVLAALLAAGPYVRNAIETGNPMYPFGEGLFPGRHWSPEAAAYLDEYYRQYKAERAQRRGGTPYRGTALLRFPWDLTMTPESFERAARQSLDTGPFALAFLPAALCLARRRRRVRFVVCLGLAYGAIIAVGAWAHPRYVLPGIVLVLAAATAGARRTTRGAFAAVAAATIAGQMLVTARLARADFPDQVRVVFGRTSRAAYLERHSNRFRFWSRACPVIGMGGSVMVLEKIPHPYFIDCRFVLASYLEQAAIDYRHVDGVDQLAAAARALGVTYVAVATADLARHADPYEARVVGLWRTWRDRLAPPVLAESGYELLALPPAGEGGGRS